MPLRKSLVPKPAIHNFLFQNWHFRNLIKKTTKKWSSYSLTRQTAAYSPACCMYSDIQIIVQYMNPTHLIQPFE